jgi:hypothetical protein
VFFSVFVLSFQNEIIKTKEHMEGGDDQGESDDEDEDEEQNRLSGNGLKKRPDPVSELVT